MTKLKPDELVAAIPGAIPESNKGKGILYSSGSTGSTIPPWSPSDCWNRTNGILICSLVIQIIILLMVVFKK